MFIWATLPDYIDTTDLLARALQTENVAFVPGRAAYLDGRGGSSMRLNFSGVDEAAIREGVRRIGKVIRDAGGDVRHADGRSARRRRHGRRAEGHAGTRRRARCPRSPTSCELPRRDAAMASATAQREDR